MQTFMYFLKLKLRLIINCRILLCSEMTFDTKTLALLADGSAVVKVY